MIEINRVLEFDAGHRILGHEHLCRHPHGHRYKVVVTLRGQLDELGRVADFGDIKTAIKKWLDATVDHAFIVYRKDKALIDALIKLEHSRVYILDENPTAENLATHFLNRFRHLFPKWPIVAVTVHETPNCWATATI